MFLIYIVLYLLCFFCSLNNPRSLTYSMDRFPVEARRGSWRAYLTITSSITDHWLSSVYLSNLDPSQPFPVNVSTVLYKQRH